MYGHQRCTNKDANLIVVLIHVGHIGWTRQSHKTMIV